MFSQALGEHLGETVNAARDPAKTLWAVINAVHARHDREEDLRGTDIARSFVAPDVLLTRLDREPKSSVSSHVLRDTNQAAGNTARMLVASREKRGVGPASPEGYAEALRVSNRDVRADLAGRTEKRERKKIGCHRDNDASFLRAAAEIFVVLDTAIRRRIREQDAEQIAGF